MKRYISPTAIRRQAAKVASDLGKSPEEVEAKLERAYRDQGIKIAGYEIREIGLDMWLAEWASNFKRQRV